MEKLRIIIDWTPDNYAAAPADDSIACVATGASLDDIKKNIVEALHFHAEGLREYGDPMPAVLAGEWQPEFELTARAALKACEAYITRKALAHETGINEQQLCHYASGLKEPRPATRKKIADGIRSISRRLAEIR